MSRYFPDVGPLFRDENNQILPDFSFFSVYGQTTEEFYQYWARARPGTPVFGAGLSYREYDGIIEEIDEYFHEVAHGEIHRGSG